MLVATHMAAAAAIYKLGSIDRLPRTARYAAIPAVLLLSFASHFALDAIPHRELQMPGNVALGLLVILWLGLIAWRDKDLLLLVTAFLGALPDLMWVLKINPAYDTIHSALHFSGVRVPPYILLVEIAGMLALLAITYRKRAKKG